MRTKSCWKKTYQLEAAKVDLPSHPDANAQRANEQSVPQNLPNNVEPDDESGGQGPDRYRACREEDDDGKARKDAVSHEKVVAEESLAELWSVGTAAVWIPTAGASTCVSTIAVAAWTESRTSIRAVRLAGATTSVAVAIPTSRWRALGTCCQPVC